MSIETYQIGTHIRISNDLVQYNIAIAYRVYSIAYITTILLNYFHNLPY